MAPHPSGFRPKAKRVIHIFANGGPSHVDTFDPKPRSKNAHGKKIPRPSADRAPDRRGLEVAVQVSEVRPERDRGQRDFPARRAKCVDDIVRHPLDARRTCRTTSRRCC